MARGPGLRRPRRRRAGDAGPGHRVGARRVSGLRRPRARGPGRCTPRRGRPFRLPRPREGGHPWLVVRRVPRRAGGAPTPRRLPRRRRRRAGHGPDPLRHRLHGALPGAAAGGARGLPAELADRGRAEPHEAAAVDPRPRRRQRVRREHAAPVPRADGGRTAPLGRAAVGDHPHDHRGVRRGEPAAAPGPVPAPGARPRGREDTPPPA